MFYTERCFTSKAECSKVERYLQTKQACQKANTCANCARAHKDCGWALGRPKEWGDAYACIVAPLWDWKYGPENVITKKSSCPSTTAIAPTRLVCPKCGTFKKNGKVSCCAPGGAWFKKCGTTQKSEHTWGDGIDACKGHIERACVYVVCVCVCVCCCVCVLCVCVCVCVVCVCVCVVCVCALCVCERESVCECVCVCVCVLFCVCACACFVCVHARVLCVCVCVCVCMCAFCVCVCLCFCVFSCVCLQLG